MKNKNTNILDDITKLELFEKNVLKLINKKNNSFIKMDISLCANAMQKPQNNNRCHFFRAYFRLRPKRF